MEIEIKIGREVEGKGVVLVPSKYHKVGRQHATLLWKDGVVLLKDNESKNGTFVNGWRVAQTKVKEDDTVCLGGDGGEDCYQVDMKKLFAFFRETEKKARTDFSEEFDQLKLAYSEYKAEETKIKSGENIKQRILSYIPMAIGAIFAALPTDLGYMRLVGFGLGVVVTLLLLSKSSKRDINEEITKLQIKYQPRYCCPKCGMKYPFTTHWRKLEADGKCPNPKCDAKFVK